MAKDKKGKKASKALKVPKEVGGVKVPKPLRKIGKQAVKAARNPMVSEIAAGALLAAAAALREGPALKAGAKSAAGSAGDGAGAAAEGAKRQAGKLGDSLKLLAIDLARKALDGLEESRRNPPAPAPAPADSPASEGGGEGPARG